MARVAVRESVTLARRAERARVARSFVSGVLGPGHRCGDDAALLVSELFGNSLQHGGSSAPGETVTVAVRAGDGIVRVEVTGRSGPGVPEPRPAGGDAEGGRGLQLVDRLAARWSWRRRGGQTVTCSRGVLEHWVGEVRPAFGPGSLAALWVTERAGRQARPVMAWWPMGPVCGACCRQIRSSPANCPSCGQHQVLLAAGPDGSRTCGPCAGHPPEFACAACSGTDTTPRRRPCDRCAMNQQLHDTLADPVLGIPAQLQPVLAHFGSAASPRSLAGWLTGMPGGMFLAALAATAHHRELTHALLDEQPQTPALHHVRDLLVQAGVLPPRDEYLERIEPWLGEILAGRPAQHAALVRPYATWHVLRRARRRCRGTSTMSAAGWARGRILAALAFLSWLDDRGTTLGTATQADVDTWLHGATRYRYLLRDFLAWASARRLAGNVTVPAPPRPS